MKKKILAVLLALALISSAFAGCAVNTQTAKEQDAGVEEKAPEARIKNVIFMIPDGAGYPTYELANDVKVAGGLNTSKFPNKTPTNTDPMTMRSYHAGSMVTLNYQEALTDSAAAGTAMATGHKTINGRIGVDHASRPVASVLEAAQSVGKSTGLVATYEWMHATPASFSSHVMERGDYRNIYQQIENQGIDVVLGSGYGAVSSYASIDNAVERGYTVVRTREALKNVKPGDRIWGDATNNSSPYDINLTQEQPTLADMTSAAITALSGDEDGFFLMVEGSKVDTGGHANDALVTTSEYLAFDAAFKVAVDFAKGREDTVIISAPDHDTGAMMYDDITDLEKVVMMVQNGINPSQVGWETTSHSTQNVGVWTYVPDGIDVVEGLSPVLGDTPENRENYVIDNTDIAPYIASFFGVDLEKLTNELFVDVTNLGRYSAGVGKFTFNSGNKYVYKNQSVYYEDGKEISMDGKIAIEIEGKFYVPESIVDDEDRKCVSEEGANEVKGSGTADDPYIIDEAWDFIEFAGNLVLGETYEGVYFLQTKDIDLVGNLDFMGLGMKQNFAGVYNGGGHEIKVELSVENDESVFPKVTGTLMNVRTTGSITSQGKVNWTYTGGIARMIDKGGKMVNCSSDMDIVSVSAGGLTGGNYGLIKNCLFGGTLKADDKLFALSAITYGGTYEDCFYLSSCGALQEEEGVTAVNEKSEETVNVLNSNAAMCAEVLETETGKISPWTLYEDSVPAIFVPVPTVEKVVVSPAEVSVKKGDGVQLSAVVEGEYGPSQEVVWSIESSGGQSASIVYEDGFVVIDTQETAEGFTVMAKSAVDGSISGICKVTVEDEVVTESDGSRARPYIISNEEEFLAFTNAVIELKSLSGLYFRQTNDLDMSCVEEYNGIPNSATFAGVYDGRGCTIKLDIDSDADNSLFGSCTGVVMNVATTGTVKGATRPSGICRAVRDRGVVVNCYSDCDIISDTEAAGIVRSNYNITANCLFAGNLTGSSLFPSCYVQPGGLAYNNYALGKDHYENATETVITSTELVSGDYIAKLNDGRMKAAKLAGVAASMLCEWENSSENGMKLKKF